MYLNKNQKRERVPAEDNKKLNSEPSKIGLPNVIVEKNKVTNKYAVSKNTISTNNVKAIKCKLSSLNTTISSNKIVNS